FVADTVNNRIQKFTNTGTFLTKWGSNGSGDGQFNTPVFVAVDGSGNVFVADNGNDRIQKFACPTAMVVPTTTTTTTTATTTSSTTTTTSTSTSSTTSTTLRPRACRRVCRQ